MMSPDLDAAEFLRRTPEQRVAKCREMAAGAERQAPKEDREARALYLQLAAMWSALADEIEGIAKG